jgi:hypothetical protein
VVSAATPRVAAFIGISGRLASESVAGMDRNHWPLCLGIRSRSASRNDSRYDAAELPPLLLA